MCRIQILVNFMQNFKTFNMTIDFPKTLANLDLLIMINLAYGEVPEYYTETLNFSVD